MLTGVKMGFVQLHSHTTLGSILDGCATPEQYAKKAAQYGHSHLAITDHGRAGGWYRHQQACLKNGVKPILGIEMYINNNLMSIGPTGKRIRSKDNHIILLAKNKAGYENLLYLNYLSMKDDEHFYYSPRITFDEIKKYKEGLIVGTACINSPFGNSFRNDEDKKNGVLLLREYQKEFGDDFYVEVQLNELTGELGLLKEGQKTYNSYMMGAATALGIPMVLTGDCHYAEKGQDKIQTYSIMIRNKDTIENTTFELESKNLYYHDVKDYQDFNKTFGYNYSEETITSLCNTTQYIADKIEDSSLIPRRKKMYLPKMSDDDDKLLVEKVKKGIVEKLGVNSYTEVPEEYKKRIAYELEIILRKGFSSYYLLFEDMYKFMRDNKILYGSSRGSGGGSLLFYAIGVTTIDPIKYGLLFERFISEQRCSDVVVNYFGE